MPEKNDSVRIVQDAADYIHIQMTNTDGKPVCLFVAPAPSIVPWGYGGRGVADLMAIREGWLTDPRSRFGRCCANHNHRGQVTVAEFVEGNLVLYPDKMGLGARAYLAGVRRWSERPVDGLAATSKR